ncbi:MAG: NYN domain-containing protein [Nanoarchaeota archaeon]|jgi:uncharacterized LabA/DUF88 family protein|nr:NYN domain-containing protein [Nanoarchaeota archaeon]
MSNRISIFIDGANFYHGSKTINTRYSDIFFDFENFIKSIVGNDELVNIYYYNAPLKENLNKYVYWNQIKLFNRLRKIPKLNLVLCKRQKRLDGSDEEYFVIKGDDIHLSIDMLRDAYKNKYDKVILISGDGDFAPLIRYVKEEGKEVVNYSFEGSASRDLLKEFPKANRLFITKKMINKNFLR